MTEVLAWVAVALAIAWFVTLRKLNREYTRFRARGLFRRWKIRPVKLEDVDPAFLPDEFGPTRDVEVSLIGGAAPGGTSTHEAWILGALSKRSRRMFEFGTCTGRTSYLWARNSPAEARITTLTLAPQQHDRCRVERGDDPADAAWALVESCFADFLYRGTDVETKIEQLFGDSKDLDPAPYAEAFDLIFIDGAHTYSYVLSDSRKALEMLKPGGLLVWHDYRGPLFARGVFRALNELADTLPLRRIEGTTLVVYRKEPVFEAA